MNKSILSVVFSAGLLSSGICFANQWIYDTQVIQVGTYQTSPVHYVWLASGSPSECVAAIPGNPTLNFNEANPGGKSLVATLTTALVANRKVSVQVSQCNIVEVYLK
jgi:hypothetical protein